MENKIEKLIKDYSDKIDWNDVNINSVDDKWYPPTISDIPDDYVIKKSLQSKWKPLDGKI